MSTAPESPPEPPDPSDLFSEVTTDEKDDALATLEAKLQQENDKRKEERFLWILVLVIVIDALLFKDASNPTTPLIVFALQLIALILIARRLGMDNLAVILDRLLNAVGPKS